MWDLNVMLLSEIILDPGLMLLTVHLNYLNLYINQRVLASVLWKETLRIWDLVKDILYDFCFRIQLQSLIWAKECSQLCYPQLLPIYSQSVLHLPSLQRCLCISFLSLSLIWKMSWRVTLYCFHFDCLYFFSKFSHNVNIF